MNFTYHLVAFAFALGVSFYLTGRFRAFLAAAEMFDTPNERSLHAQLTPRGGGVVFAGLTAFAHAVALVLGKLPVALGLSALLIGAGFALLGWWDDRASRPTLLRLLAQFALGVPFVVVAAWMSRNALPLPLLSIAAAAALLGTVWSVNLFNFMDGADGYAATQALTAALGGGVLLHVGGSPALATLTLCFAGACAGFLVWNWSPARLFMGDAGSYFLGFHFVALAALGGATGATAMASWLILLAPFVTDATLTVIGRLLRGERFWHAHRAHAYQKLILEGREPAHLSLMMGLYVVVICWPCALFATVFADYKLTCTLSVYALSGMIWLTIDRRTT